PGGRMLTIQSTGKDPGMEIIRNIWPDENPFQTSRQMLLRELRAQLRSSQPDLRYHPYSDQRSEFSYAMHMQPMEIGSNIGTSTSSSFRHCSSSVSRLPAAVDAKPHCGLRARFSIGT